MKSLYKAKLNFLFSYLLLLTISLLVLDNLLNALINKEQKEKFVWVQHTNEVIVECKNLLNALIDVETGQRGFLLTRNKEYLEPYVDGKSSAHKIFSSLYDLTLDNHIQTVRLKKVRELMKLKLNELNATISDRNYTKALELVNKNIGKEYMDKIRDHISLLIEEEKRLLKIRKRAFDEMTSNNIITLKLIIYVLFAVMLYFIFVSIVRKKDIEHINKNLEEQIHKEVLKSQEKDKTLLIQSRQAQMGELISMIAHQWRQPLTAISSVTANIQMKQILDNLNKNKILDSMRKIDSYVLHLTEVIDDFRSFYKPNKASENSSLGYVCKKTLSICRDSLETDSIMIVEEYNDSGSLKLFVNELIQVLLNVLKNAQDNFIEKNIQEPVIKITTSDDTISICDNGGGVPEHIIEKIFEPYFSTKNEKNGTGIGLYMSKIIIEEHHNGRLSAENNDQGTCFYIKVFSNLK